MASFESNCRVVQPEVLLRMLVIETPDCRTINPEIPVFWIDRASVEGDYYAFGSSHELSLEGLRQSRQTYISVASPHRQYVLPSLEATEPVLLVTVFLAPQAVFAQMNLAIVTNLVEDLARLDGADQNG